MRMQIISSYQMFLSEKLKSFIVVCSDACNDVSDTVRSHKQTKDLLDKRQMNN